MRLSSMVCLRRGAVLSGFVLMTTIAVASHRVAMAEDAKTEGVVAMPVASIGGDVTEILYALGSSDSIVAIDTTSVYPPEALRTKKNVGYMRALSTEGVLSTGARTLIASDRAGPPEVVAALKGASIAFHEIKEPNSAEGVASKVKAIGKLVGKSEAADTLAAKTSEAFTQLEAVRSKITKKKRVLFVLAAQDGRITVGGGNTSAQAVLELAGATNAAAAIDGFKPVTDEQLVEMAPDAVVVMKRSGLKTDPVAAVRDAQGLSASPAIAANRVFGMDGQYVLGFGPRAADAAKDLMLAIYPDLAAYVKVEER